jgi:hypothetical protein
MFKADWGSNGMPIHKLPLRATNLRLGRLKYFDEFLVFEDGW